MVYSLVSAAMTTSPRIPVATYRLQFNRSFTFRDATGVVPYLAALGISHCYSSPYLRARPGSSHGYDIVDHNALNPEIGSAEDYEQFVAELHRHNMGQILDIVPNHMGVMGSDNAWWLDILENGEASEYADFFDIDWEPIKEELRGKTLVPVLEDQYGKVLEKGELQLSLDVETGEFSILYHQNRFPIDPLVYPRILAAQLESLEEKLGPAHQDFLELQSITTAFGHLPSRSKASPEQKLERNREKEIQKRRLAALCARSDEVLQFLTDQVRVLNGTVGEPRSFDSLHELIKAQAYRLAQWRVAADDINYRRFFDIDDLAGLRTENEAVFALTHRFVFDLLAQGKINGLRIDHPDGLYNPGKYFRELNHAVGASDRGPNLAESNGIYVVIEKILTGTERLCQEWPVSGTTGYEFANLVNGLFVDQSAATKAERIYRAFVEYPVDFPTLAYNCKKLTLKVSLFSELNVLANALSRIALSSRHTCDFTLHSLTSALIEIIASLSVYRTYENDHQLSSEDRDYIERAVAEGRKRSHAGDLTVFDFIRRALLMETNGDELQSQQLAVTRFAMRFQQVTSAVMAKGLEDMAFYRYNRLIALNEVGGNPSKFGVSVEEFHQANQDRLKWWPHSMLSTSTHDSKRSEDVRARIDVLSEIPAVWRLRVRHWRDWNRGRKRLVDGKPAPSRNDEYMLYQTLVGAWPVESPDTSEWPAFVQRIQQYALKAVREGKECTSWVNPNADYEDALKEFIGSILERRAQNRFLANFSDFHHRISRLGMFNSLSQTLLKLTSPGVPDVYQGNEIWDFSLVDPDNRRPVDYARRQRLLQEMQKSGQSSDWMPAHARELLENMDDGRIKMYGTWMTLCFRRQYRELFQDGAYTPLTVSGSKAGNLCAFARELDEQIAIVIVPVLCATLLGDQEENPVGERVWGDTRIEIPRDAQQIRYHNLFTNEVITAAADAGRRFLVVSAVLKSFPAALISGQCMHATSDRMLRGNH